VRRYVGSSIFFLLRSPRFRLRRWFCAVFLGCVSYGRTELLVRLLLLLISSVTSLPFRFLVRTIVVPFWLEQPVVSRTESKRAVTNFFILRLPRVCGYATIASCASSARCVSVLGQVDFILEVLVFLWNPFPLALLAIRLSVRCCRVDRQLIIG